MSLADRPSDSSRAVVPSVRPPDECRPHHPRQPGCVATGWKPCQRETATATSARHIAVACGYSPCSEVWRVLCHPPIGPACCAIAWLSRATISRRDASMTRGWELWFRVCSEGRNAAIFGEPNREPTAAVAEPRPAMLNQHPPSSEAHRALSSDACRRSDRDWGSRGRGFKSRRPDNDGLSQTALPAGRQQPRHVVSFDHLVVFWERAPRRDGSSRGERLLRQRLAAGLLDRIWSPQDSLPWPRQISFGTTSDGRWSHRFATIVPGRPSVLRPS